MIRSRSIGLMVSDPQRGHVAFHNLAALLAPPADLDGLGVATCVDNAVLLSRRPAPDLSEGLAKLIGPLKGRCGVIQLRGADELRPPRTTPTNLGPFRWRHFACAVVGGPQDPDDAAVSREKLLTDLPDFLRRSVTGQTEGEAFFYAVMAKLHEKGGLERAPRGPDIVDAIRRTLEDTAEHRRHVVIATGLEVVACARGWDCASIRVDGLSEDTAEELDPTLVDSSMGRERLRRFRGVLLCGGVEGDLESLPPMPSSVGLNRHGDEASIVISRDFETTAL